MNLKLASKLLVIGVVTGVKDPQIGLSTINAKAETVATASSFREAFKRRRCLVPADAFLEWQKIDA
jgi:putative SOS response-associated peptidase YedK